MQSYFVTETQNMNEEKKLQLVKIISIANFAAAGLLLALPPIMRLTNPQLFFICAVFIIIVIHCNIFTGNKKDKVYDDSRLLKINRNQLIISTALSFASLIALVFVLIKFRSPSLYPSCLKLVYFLIILSVAYQFFIFFKKNTTSIAVLVFALAVSISGLASLFYNSVFLLIASIMLLVFSTNFLMQKNI